MTRSSEGYPLAALFLLVSLFAILTAQLTPVIGSVMDDQLDAPAFFAFSLIAMATSIVLGLLIGLYHYRVGRGIAWGVSTGVVIGAFCGPIGYISTVLPAHTLALAAGGSVILLVIAWGYRLLNNHDPSTRRDLYERMLNAYRQRSVKPSDTANPFHPGP